MKSSSESIPFDAVVSGVGGAASGPAEAIILLLGRTMVEDTVASAAFRFRVVGGMVPIFQKSPGWSSSHRPPRDNDTVESSREARRHSVLGEARGWTWGAMTWTAPR